MTARPKAMAENPKRRRRALMAQGCVLTSSVVAVSASTSFQGRNVSDNPDYETTRQRHLAAALEQLPGYLERLKWPRERLRQERQGRLRRLLERARERSPWHRRRLAHLDLSRLDEGQLTLIPPMTKDELMLCFDQIVTEPQLTLSRVEDHLAGLNSDAYLCDSYHAVASGGSSGRRGVYVYDWNGWIGWYLTVLRQMFPILAAHTPPGTRIAGAVVAAERATHASSAAAQTFRDSGLIAWSRYAITDPFQEQVARLNQLQPSVLATYPSLLHQLSFAQEAGELKIAPRLVLSSAEPLLAETRASVERVWGCPVINSWASSEAGGMGVGCGQGTGLHLSDDLLIIEPVDREGRPVPPGVRSSKIYVTNLFNEVLPLIRFEISDEVTVLDHHQQACPCGSSHRLAADVEGRLDDSFEYAGVAPIHPQLFRTRLGRERHVVEYQVRQRPGGVDVYLREQGPTDLIQLRNDLIASLSQAGLEQPLVLVHTKAAFERTSAGKFKRFVPLGSAG